jgi:hypothetical protein
VGILCVFVAFGDFSSRSWFFVGFRATMRMVAFSLFIAVFLAFSPRPLFSSIFHPSGVARSGRAVVMVPKCPEVLEQTRLCDFVVCFLLVAARFAPLLSIFKILLNLQSDLFSTIVPLFDLRPTCDTLVYFGAPTTHL